jgi:hypothetical protein
MNSGLKTELSFPTLFDFGMDGPVPEPLRPTCHIFYEARFVEMNDGLPKWSGQPQRSRQLFEQRLCLF